MMRFAADENFNGDVLDGLLIRIPELDTVRVQDTSLYGADDPDLLEWLAKEDRILFTHDINTMPGFFFDRVKSGLTAPGIVVIPQNFPVGKAIDELELMIGAGSPADFENQVKNFVKVFPKDYKKALKEKNVPLITRISTDKIASQNP